MAYLVRRPGGKVQIRESVRTEHGPRSRILASFRGALNEEILSAAATKAVRPLDRAGLIEKAKALGIGWTSTANTAARQLVKRLRREQALDPVLVSLLRRSLSNLREAEVPDELDEAADWLGCSDQERGRTLRGLLRLSDAIARSRDTAPFPRPSKPYPEIDSKVRGAA